jgi:hypothetical protein
MADLMAYLQVVANNSNQLPLTRRDDPELDRTVSTLSAEDFSRKSAAFVPADVRVLGGTFTRYGRVWDLPTSEVGRDISYRYGLIACTLDTWMDGYITYHIVHILSLLNCVRFGTHVLHFSFRILFFGGGCRSTMPAMGHKNQDDPTVVPFAIPC